MAKTNESDVWDQDPLGSGRFGSTFVKRTPNVKQAAKTRAVRDDWDDDDDDDDDEEQENDAGEKERDKDGASRTPSGMQEREAEEGSNEIWEEANKRAPMPELIVASSSTSQSLPQPPPPAALQPALRILKRPSANTGANNVGVAPLTPSSPGPNSGSGSGSGSGGTSPAPRGTLAEREAQYQEARSRIFGEKTSGDASSGSGSGGVVIARDPLGPMSEPGVELGRPARGFGERRSGKKQ